MRITIFLRNGQFIDLVGLTKEEIQTLHQGIIDLDFVSFKTGIFRCDDVTHTHIYE